jgi:hypothetical protein
MNKDKGNAAMLAGLFWISVLAMGLSIFFRLVPSDWLSWGLVIFFFLIALFASAVASPVKPPRS